ncbi:nucleolin isoform X3 [Patella vulgata]|uniref:nucleolin isoform X3 n=1 Tax=Patella vulgata TaxID=6465 RepID=UPI00217FC517|nr:nucleolin isoform X3 [Patella vulgata]
MLKEKTVKDKGVSRKKKSKQQAPVVKEEEDSTSDDDDERDNKYIRKIPKSSIKSEGSKQTDSSESSDDDDDDDDDDEIKEELGNKRKKTTQVEVPIKKIKKEDDDDDDDDDDDEPIKKIKTEEIPSIFLGGLNKETTAETIEEYLTKKGITVTEVRKKKGKRFGHCDLASEDDLLKAIKLNKKDLDGAEVEIKKATGPRPVSSDGKPRRGKVGKKTLVVRNLHYKVNEDKLHQYFKKAVAIRIPTFSDTGKSRGKAFVDFRDVEDAKEAVKAMHGLFIEGRQIYLEFTPESGKAEGLTGDVSERRKVKKAKRVRKEFSENKFEDDSD